MSQIIRKKGKFSQKKPLHSDWVPVHSSDAYHISVVHIFVRFCSPVIMELKYVLIDAITTNGWRT